MKQLLYFISIFLLASCSQQDAVLDSISEKDIKKDLTLTLDEISALTFNATEEISEEEAISMASEFLKGIEGNNTTKSRNKDNLDIEIISKTYYKTSSNSRSYTDSAKAPIYQIYISSEQESKIMYLGANKYFPDVITCTTASSGDKDIFEKSGAAFLHKWAEESYLNRLLNLSESMELLKSQAIEKLEYTYNCPITEEFIDSIVNNCATESRATPITMPSTQIISMKGPFVKVEWNQTEPYNSLLPEPLYSSYLSHVYTGCAVTAACQLMTYIKPKLTINGIDIDWNKLSENKKISSTDSPDKLRIVGELHKWVYNQLHAQPQYSNGEHTGTGVSADAQVWFYGNYFNHSEEYGAYDPDALLRSFNQGHPSLIRGQGHAWLVDGYIIAEKTNTIMKSHESRSDIVKVYDMYWHTNLGWGGSYNGYYKLDPDTHVSFEAGYHTFTTDGLYIYPGLYSKETEYIF